MSVDHSKVKPGDEVTVRLTYVGASETASGWRRLKNSANEVLAVHKIDFVSHSPKPLAVGDRVRDGRMTDAIEATVLFADERDTVIRTDEGGIHSGPTSGSWVAALERVDA